MKITNLFSQTVDKYVSKIIYLSFLCQKSKTHEDNLIYFYTRHSDGVQTSLDSCMRKGESTHGGLFVYL